MPCAHDTQLPIRRVDARIAVQNLVRVGDRRVPVWKRLQYLAGALLPLRYVRPGLDQPDGEPDGVAGQARNVPARGHVRLAGQRSATAPAARTAHRSAASRPAGPAAAKAAAAAATTVAPAESKTATRSGRPGRLERPFAKRASGQSQGSESRIHLALAAASAAAPGWHLAAASR